MEQLELLNICHAANLNWTNNCYWKSKTSNSVFFKIQCEISKESASKIDKGSIKPTKRK